MKGSDEVVAPLKRRTFSVPVESPSASQATGPQPYQSKRNKKQADTEHNLLVIPTPLIQSNPIEERTPNQLDTPLLDEQQKEPTDPTQDTLRAIREKLSRKNMGGHKRWREDRPSLKDAALSKTFFGNRVAEGISVDDLNKAQQATLKKMIGRQIGAKKKGTINQPQPNSRGINKHAQH